MFSVDSGVIQLPNKEEVSTVGEIAITFDSNVNKIIIQQQKLMRTKQLIYSIYTWLNQSLVRFCNLLQEISNKTIDFPLELGGSSYTVVLLPGLDNLLVALP